MKGSPSAQERLFTGTLLSMFFAAGLGIFLPEVSQHKLPDTFWQFMAMFWILVSWIYALTDWPDKMIMVWLSKTLRLELVPLQSKVLRTELTNSPMKRNNGWGRGRGSL